MTRFADGRIAAMPRDADQTGAGHHAVAVIAMALLRPSADAATNARPWIAVRPAFAIPYLCHL